MPDTKTLHQVLMEQLGSRNIEKTALPEWLAANLNPAFELRPYQTRAFKFFLNYWEEEFTGKPRRNHQLLFHMATGSGKTLIMAGLILYLYQKGYRNFLFFVNSNNIIRKTKDNFLNPSSSKYLFAPEIGLGDTRINISSPDNFQASNGDDISIVFSTIQWLHTSLNTPRENGLTYEDFEENRLVLISDEAHHINAETKKAPKSAQVDFGEVDSWEKTVERIFRANENNVLLEFTATVDLSDSNLAAKYNPKLIFDYPLRDFRKDRYSKEVKVLQADMAPLDRALQAVLLSQYRRKLFERSRIRIKPVILFKSRTIKDSQAFFTIFSEAISELDGAAIVRVRDVSKSPVLAEVFRYFEAEGIDVDNLASEIREDFAPDKLLSINSKDESENKQLAVNSLEDPSNEYRAVFAVDKLNEGWDVLNLFDIVRLYDTRDSKAGKPGKTTMSEAQLIGRGARYCPFRIIPEQPLYERKYDADVGNQLRVCEELYYHAAYNPQYIQELNIALRAIGMKADETRERTIKLKTTFQKTDLYQKGHLFLNTRVRADRSGIAGLGEAVSGAAFRYSLRTNFAQASVAFETATSKGIEGKATKDFDLGEFPAPVLRKAIQRVSFFEFANLRRHYPMLKSINEFVASKEYLGGISVEVSGLAEQLAKLSPDDQLAVTVSALESIAQLTVSNEVAYQGTTLFRPVMIRDTFVDKIMSFAADAGGESEYGRSMATAAETEYHLDLGAKQWYAFDDCFGTAEEKLLILFIDKKYDELAAKYSDVFLLRNEKHFQIFNFSDGRPLEPDFVLYLIGLDNTPNLYYQIFVEPKGGHLLLADAWKEKFLLSLAAEAKVEQLFSDREYRVFGLPFFNAEFRDKEFGEAFAELEK